MSVPPPPRGTRVCAEFDDHLRVLQRTLTRHRLILFTGMSGSGKSTYLSLLVHCHPDFQGRPYDWIGPTPIDWSSIEPSEELVLVDEIQRPIELMGIFDQLADEDKHTPRDKLLAALTVSYIRTCLPGSAMSMRS